jgi:mobilome CxxCx(11)CxxC protein
VRVQVDGTLGVPAFNKDGRILPDPKNCKFPCGRGLARIGLVPRDPALDPLRQDCWDHALHSFAAAAIFERRIRSLSRRLRFLTFLGIVVPALFGALVLGFGLTPDALKWSAAAAAIVGSIQLVASIWSLVVGWDQRLAEASQGMDANSRLCQAYRRLGADPPSDIRTRYDILEATRQEQRAMFNDAEKRFGMRAGLREFQRPCAGCNEVPTSMKPSSCNVCGNF